ncbi:MAG: Na/Pi cotransporter family protein [Clostridia bacterium]|nr:Na/Pi cotransporter family protein [Clostridia bacterium]
MPTEILSMLAMLLGGLTFFLFGMSIMSTGLEQMAGGGLERTLNKMAKNDFAGFALGAGITVAIQSSSAMTVMLVGLVNSGILLFENTFGMIMGSHVGTTLTAWILTLNANSGSNFFMALLKPMNFAPILAFVGIILRMASKKAKRRSLGDIFIGFAIIMVGMNMMSESMSNVKQYSGMLTLFASSPILAFLVSTLFTGAIQSSAATVAIVQAFALSSVGLNYKAAIPLVVGANIGTCMTALISSVGTNKNAKRVVALHTYTNAIGGVLVMIVLYIVNAINPDLLSAKTSIIGVAVIHTLFNVLNTIFFIPFKKPLIKLCEKTVKKDDDKTHTVFLDERIFNNPPLAISECQRLTNEMADLSRASINSAIDLLNNFDGQEFDYIQDAEKLIDKYEDKLGTYLLKISSLSLNENDSYTVSKMLHAIGDFERIGDHALNIASTAKEMSDNSLAFSKDASHEIEVISNAVKEILELSIDSFIENNDIKAAHVEPLEQVIDSLRDSLKSAHINRLQKGECTIKLGFIFTDLLSDYERVSDHCSNIAAYTLQNVTLKFDNHKYLNKIKNQQIGAFRSDFEMYEKKYSV